MSKIGMTERGTLKSDEVDENRYFECAGYDDCLHDAVMQNFSGFTCKGCPAFEEYLKAREQSIEYTIRLRDNTQVVKKFCPGVVELDKKNEGTLWND